MFCQHSKHTPASLCPRNPDFLHIFMVYFSPYISAQMLPSDAADPDYPILKLHLLPQPFTESPVPLIVTDK